MLPLRRYEASRRCPTPGRHASASCVTFRGFESAESRFPVGWFYFARPDHADVVRLLSDAEDLPVILADLDTTDPPPRTEGSADRQFGASGSDVPNHPKLESNYAMCSI